MGPWHQGVFENGKGSQKRENQTDTAQEVLSLRSLVLNTGNEVHTLRKAMASKAEKSKKMDCLLEPP